MHESSRMKIFLFSHSLYDVKTSLKETNLRQSKQKLRVLRCNQADCCTIFFHKLITIFRHYAFSSYALHCTYTRYTEKSLEERKIGLENQILKITNNFLYLLFLSLPFSLTYFSLIYSFMQDDVNKMFCHLPRKMNIYTLQ